MKKIVKRGNELDKILKDYTVNLIWLLYSLFFKLIKQKNKMLNSRKYVILLKNRNTKENYVGKLYE